MLRFAFVALVLLGIVSAAPPARAQDEIVGQAPLERAIRATERRLTDVDGRASVQVSAGLGSVAITGRS